jgi:hypothetical protein
LPDVLAAAGSIAVPLLIGAIAVPVVAGAIAVPVVAGAMVGAAMAGAVAAAGGVASDAASSLLPQAPKLIAAANVRVHINVWRIIFMENLQLKGRTEWTNHRVFDT